MGKGIAGLSGRIMPIFINLITEISNLSWIALVTMLCIGGVLCLFGNEFGAKKICRNALYGFLLIQLAGMLV